MPIIARLLTKLANREDIGPGVKRWRVNGSDAIGGSWLYGPFSVTQLEAEAIRDSIVWALPARDLRDVLAWVQARNTVASFDYTNRDIVQADAEEHVFQWFAESLGAEAITVAWWMDGINTGTFNAIRDRIGYTGAQGADITSRFTFLLNAEPWYDFTVKAP